MSIMASRRASTSLCFSLHLIWHSLAIGVTLSLWYGFSRKSIQPIIMTSSRASISVSYIGFSRRSTSLMTSRCTSSSLSFDYASLVRVPAFDLPLCEFQSFDITSRFASSGSLIWPLALQVPVFQSDLSLCEFQSFNMTSTSLSIRPLTVRVPVVQYDLSLCEFRSLTLSLPQEYTVRFSPKTLLLVLSSLTRVFSRRSKSEDFIIWPLPQELCQRSSRVAIKLKAYPCPSYYIGFSTSDPASTVRRLSNHLHSSRPCSGQPIEFYWVW